MRPKILFLRPFWDEECTARQLSALSDAIKSLADVVVIRNANENRHLDDAASHVTLIDASDDDWRSQAIELIAKADCVVLNIAPKAGPDAKLPADIAASAETHPEFSDYLRQIRIHAVGTGRGLLQELRYCRLAHALDKVVALVPAAFWPRVKQAIQHATGPYAAISTSGALFLKAVGNQLAETFPKVSPLDMEIRNLQSVHSIVVYQDLGDSTFCSHLHSALRRYFEDRTARNQSVDHPAERIIVGTPDKPIPLPPDGAMKRLRFTPVERLSALPRHEIVEISLDEARALYPDLPKERFECLMCHEKPDGILYFQLGLGPTVTKGAMAFLKCQSCGFYVDIDSNF